MLECQERCERGLYIVGCLSGRVPAAGAQRRYRQEVRHFIAEHVPEAWREYCQSASPAVCCCARMRSDQMITLRAHSPFSPFSDFSILNLGELSLPLSLLM